MCISVLDTIDDFEVFSNDEADNIGSKVGMMDISGVCGQRISFEC